MDSSLDRDNFLDFCFKATIIITPPVSFCETVWSLAKNEMDTKDGRLKAAGTVLGYLSSDKVEFNA